MENLGLEQKVFVLLYFAIMDKMKKQFYILKIMKLYLKIYQNLKNDNDNDNIMDFDLNRPKLNIKK